MDKLSQANKRKVEQQNNKRENKNIKQTYLQASLHASQTGKTPKPPASAQLQPGAPGGGSNNGPQLRGTMRTLEPTR